jgi:hypothetical protein
VGVAAVVRSAGLLLLLAGLQGGWAAAPGGCRQLQAPAPARRLRRSRRAHLERLRCMEDSRGEPATRASLGVGDCAPRWPKLPAAVGRPRGSGARCRTPGSCVTIPAVAQAPSARSPVLRGPLTWGESMLSLTVLDAGEVGTSGVARPPDGVPICVAAAALALQGRRHWRFGRPMPRRTAPRRSILPTRSAGEGGSDLLSLAAAWAPLPPRPPPLPAFFSRYLSSCGRGGAIRGPPATPGRPHCPFVEPPPSACRGRRARGGPWRIQCRRVTPWIAAAREIVDVSTAIVYRPTSELPLQSAQTAELRCNGRGSATTRRRRLPACSAAAFVAGAAVRQAPTPSGQWPS